MTMSRMRLLSMPFATISNDWTMGTPAAIIVVICRANIAMSPGVIFLPPEALLPRFFLTVGATMPWRRSLAFTRATLGLDTSPRCLTPLASLPSHS